MADYKRKIQLRSNANYYSENLLILALGIAAFFPSSTLLDDSYLSGFIFCSLLMLLLFVSYFDEKNSLEHNIQ